MLRIGNQGKAHVAERNEYTIENFCHVCREKWTPAIQLKKRVSETSPQPALASAHA